MTKSVNLQIKEGLVTLFGAIPGVNAAFLSRQQPVGESERKAGPVIILREEVTSAATDNQLTLPQTLQLRISIYVSLTVGEETLDELVDPYWQAINTVMHGSARQLPGVQGVTFVQKEPEAEDDAGRLDVFWNIIYRTYQLDLTQPAP
jgi:hypothetical protein